MPAAWGVKVRVKVQDWLRESDEQLLVCVKSEPDIKMLEMVVEVGGGGVWVVGAVTVMVEFWLADPPEPMQET